MCLAKMIPLQLRGFLCKLIIVSKVYIFCAKEQQIVRCNFFLILLLFHFYYIIGPV